MSRRCKECGAAKGHLAECPEACMEDSDALHGTSVSMNQTLVCVLRDAVSELRKRPELTDEQAADYIIREIDGRLPIYEDVYGSLCDALEPHVEREGVNPEGTLPASVVESFDILLEHWVKNPPIRPQDILDRLPPKTIADLKGILTKSRKISDELIMPDQLLQGLVPATVYRYLRKDCVVEALLYCVQQEGFLVSELSDHGYYTFTWSP